MCCRVRYWTLEIFLKKVTDLILTKSGLQSRANEYKHSFGGKQFTGKFTVYLKKSKCRREYFTP